MPGRGTGACDIENMFHKDDGAPCLYHSAISETGGRLRQGTGASGP